MPNPYADIWALFHYKDRFSQVWDSHVKDKTVARPSYLWYGDPYTDKTTSLYWDGPLVLLALNYFAQISYQCNETHLESFINLNGGNWVCFWEQNPKVIDDNN